MKRSITITFVAITANLILAAILMSNVFGGVGNLAAMFTKMPLNLIVGIIALYTTGYFQAKKMHRLINTQHRNHIATGIFGAFIILFIGILLGSTVGFIKEGIGFAVSSGRVTEALFDYYVKPIYWILLAGALPTFIMGAIMGYYIKER